ncbi:MAG TPA: DUF1015 domain-containing protein, partial [Pyrinomonadaceae bacterium]
MAIIRPFRALRPPRERAKSVSSVPYDVVNTEEARALAQGNALSFLHVSRPEIDLPDGTDIYSDAVYRKAVQNFQDLTKNSPLEKETEPSLYLYRLVMGNHQQIGVVACSSIDEYDRNEIRKHERTRPDKEDDRTRHMLMLRAQTGPVFLTYRQRPEIDQLVSKEISRDPLYDFAASDGVRHTIWRITDPEQFVQCFAEVPLLYIADGHHRAASASRARAELKEQSFGHTGSEDYNYFLTVIFPDSQLQILAYNRVVRELNGLSKDEFLQQVSRQFKITENGPPAPSRRGQWSMYLDGQWHALELSPDATLPVGTVASLDVSVLQDRLLDPILGIKDIRTD